MMQTRKKAFLFMVGWAFFFVTAMSFNKRLDLSIPTEIIVFYRLSFALFWFSPYLFKNRKTIFKTSIFKWHLLRAVFTSLTIACTYYSYRHLPLATATSIGLSGPLFTTLLAAIFFKEKLTLKKISIILIGYFGVLCVVTKDIIAIFITFITSFFIDKTFFTMVVDPSFLKFEETIMIALLGNVLMGFVLILLKKVTKSDKPTTVLFYNTFLTTLLVGGYSVTSFNILDCNNFLILIFIGVLGLFLQFFYTKAMSLEKASFVAPLEYLRIIFAIPVGIFLFGDVVTPQIVVGIFLIFVSTNMLTRGLD